MPGKPLAPLSASLLLLALSLLVHRLATIIPNHYSISGSPLALRRTLPSLLRNVNVALPFLMRMTQRASWILKRLFPILQIVALAPLPPLQLSKLVPHPRNNASLVPRVRRPWVLPLLNLPSCLLKALTPRMVLKLRTPSTRTTFSPSFSSRYYFFLNFRFLLIYFLDSSLLPRVQHHFQDAWS